MNASQPQPQSSSSPSTGAASVGGEVSGGFSLEDLRPQLQARLNSAFDLGQMIGIFEKLFEVVDEQRHELLHLRAALLAAETRVDQLTPLAEQVRALQAGLARQGALLEDVVLQQRRTGEIKPAQQLLLVDQAADTEDIDGEVFLLEREDEPSKPLSPVVTSVVEPISTPHITAAAVLEDVQQGHTSERSVEEAAPPMNSKAPPVAYVAELDTPEASDGGGRGVPAATLDLVALDSHTFILVQTPEEHAAVAELLDATTAAARREALLAGLRRGGRVIRNLHRTQHDAAPASLSRDAVLRRIAALETALTQQQQQQEELLLAAPPIGREELAEAVAALLQKRFPVSATIPTSTSTAGEDEAVTRKELAEVFYEVLSREPPFHREPSSAELRGLGVELLSSLAGRAPVYAELSALRAAVEELGRDARVAVLEERLDRQKARADQSARELQRAITQAAAAAPSWRAELEALAYTVDLLSGQQVAAVKQLMADLSRLQTELSRKLEERDILLLIAAAESAFKQDFGDDLGNVKSAVAKVSAAVQERPSRAEVAALLAERLDALQKLFPDRDEGSASAAVKCLSCGQPRAEQSLHDGSLASELSLDPAHMSRADLDLYRAVLSRSAGLKSLSKTSSPLQPRAFPPAQSHSHSHSHSQQQQQQQRTVRGTSSESGPLFRRAQIAAQLKEMVKVVARPPGEELSPLLLFDDDSHATAEARGATQGPQKGFQTLPRIQKGGKHPLQQQGLVRGSELDTSVSEASPPQQLQQPTRARTTGIATGGAHCSARAGSIIL